ncbi:uncharacterized protein LOC107304321 [Oryza brachyantha]|uniref:uncharacterized protein LOC107304321 n=1 Tax=Oryza brachyantha TaxID=4533 RepID=UPI0007768D5E|nr:uncharacterized protein LOC107304321 [Oryza brachyantha]
MVGYTLDQDYTPYPSADPPKTLTNQIVVGLVDDTSFQWWVSVMDEAIGYYPEGVFDTRFPEAGGRVVDTRPGGAHTSTPMGNGIPACGGGLFAATVFEYLGISANGELFNDANPLGVDDKRPGYYVAYGRRRRDL